MAHAIVHNEPLHMGAPVPHGKLAMWIFLATEIMFFTALIGTYSILRNGQPTKDEPWPKPHDVHLVEWIGAFNTFVLIYSSVSVVLAHWTLCRGNAKQAAYYVAVTLALGCVFLLVKAYEYNSKFQHEIIPGHVFDRIDGPRGVEYMNKVKRRAEAPPGTRCAGGVKEQCSTLLAKLELKAAGRIRLGSGRQVKEIFARAGTPPDRSSCGNLWASCCFTMTGFHALHVLGGL